ncbi:MAG: putative secreted protein with C-terminal beta-propeller domain, partial [Acidimicrobiales bacterium]
MKKTSSLKKTAVALMGLTLLATACTSDGSDATLRDDTPTDRTIDIGQPGVDLPLLTALTTFGECSEYLESVQANALEVVGPWGLEQNYFFGGGIVEDFASEESADRDSSISGGLTQDTLATTSGEAGVDFSTTNVQELGVDEPDLIKTDGDRIVALAQGTVHIIDVTGDNAELQGSVSVDDIWTQDMFMQGDSVLLLAHSSSEYGRGGNYYSPLSVLVEIDISDGADPQVVRRMEMDGSYLSARMIDGVVRVVVQSSVTGIEWEYPEGGGLRAERNATEANQELIQNSTVDNWLPYYILSDGSGRQLSEGNLVECDRAYHPEEFSGLNLLNVVTIDMSADGLGGDIDGVGVLADGQTVYSSTDNMYIGTTKWVDWAEFEDARNAGEAPPAVTTEIHKFDISDPTSTDYVASGAVTGTVLSQYSLSEHEGNLRVATTVGALWGWTDESESFVTVLEQQDVELVNIGQVGDLGLGEQIFAVRFMGDIATVVTFRQTDPLYTIDLSDPTNPTVLGELKILGYSAYLHPISDTLVIGVGQDATEEGRTTGTQVSLFDISDLENPVRLSQWHLPGGWTQAEFNPRAFLYWAAEDLLVLPVNVWGYEQGAESFLGAVALDVSENVVSERARITHAEPGK